MGVPKRRFWKLRSLFKDPQFIQRNNSRDTRATHDALSELGAGCSEHSKNTPFYLIHISSETLILKFLEFFWNKFFIFGREIWMEVKFGPKHFCFGAFGLQSNHLPKLDLFSDCNALCPIINLFIMEIKKSFKRS